MDNTFVSLGNESIERISQIAVKAAETANIASSSSNEFTSMALQLSELVGHFLLEKGSESTHAVVAQAHGAPDGHQNDDHYFNVAIGGARR